jgi:hypothetical protein
MSTILRLAALAIAALGLALPAGEGPAFTPVPLTVTTPAKNGEMLWGVTGCAFARVDDQGLASIAFAPAKGGRLLLRREGGRLQVDSDLDGALTATDARITAMTDFDGESATVTVPVTIDGRVQQMALVFMVQDDFVIIQGRSLVRGTWNGVTMEIIDGNLDGRLDGAEDLMQVPDAGGGSHAVRMGSSVILGGQVLRLRWSEGQCLVMAAHPGPFAPLTLACADPAWTVRVQATAVADGPQVDLAGGQAATVPVGAYRVEMTQADCRVETAAPKRQGGLLRRLLVGEGDPPDTLTLSGGGEPLVVTVAEGGATVNVGPPFTLAVEAARIGDEVAVLGAWLVGVGGERYRASISGAQDVNASWHLRRGDQEQAGGTLEYG